MGDGIHCANNSLKIFLLWVHVMILFYSYLFYLTEKVHSDIYVPSNCQINQTFIQEVPCSKTKQTISKKLCKQTYYGIIHDNKMFTTWDWLPTWLSPIDAKNLCQNPMIFAGKILPKPMNITCYYNRLTSEHIRWTKPDPKGFLRLILLSSIAIILIIIHSFGECSYQRRSYRR